MYGCLKNWIIWLSIENRMLNHYIFINLVKVIIIMKKFIEWFKQGLWFMFAILICFWIYFWVRAWNETTLEWVSWDKITVSRWNALVNKVNSISTSTPTWEEVDINDTTTMYDRKCQRRWERVNSAATCTDSSWNQRYVDFVSATLDWIRYVEPTASYRVIYSNKKTMCQNWWTTCSRKICKIEKLCN